MATTNSVTTNSSDHSTASPGQGFAVPTVYKARFEEKVDFSEKYGEYQFELIDPHRMSFKAGQYVSIKVNPEGERRAYSIINSSAVDHGFSLLIDFSPGGKGSKYLQSLKFGDEIDIIGPLGRFVVEDNQDPELVFIATGAGIAPIRGMILDQLQVKKDKRPITLYWGMRYVQELFWVDELEDLTESFPNFSFHPVISKAIEEWPLCRGRVTDCLNIHDVNPQAGFYLCGSTQMITDVGAVLLQKGVTQQQLYYEKFY